MMSMAKLVCELSKEPSLPRNIAVQTLPALANLVDEAVRAIARDNAFLIIKDKCFQIMRNYSPLQIPIEKRRNFLILLIKQVANRNLNELSFDCESRKKLKSDYLEVISSLPIDTDKNLKLLMNVGLQALCKDTALGRVFHIKRKATAPSITSGVLQALSRYLNLQAAGREVEILHPNTQAALQAECRRSQSFANKLQQYPALYAWAEPALAVVLAEKKNAKKQKSQSSNTEDSPHARIELRPF